VGESDSDKAILNETLLILSTNGTLFAQVRICYMSSFFFSTVDIFLRRRRLPSLRRTRKPCYRKDDRAMRPIYGCPEKFRESSQTPPVTFPEICKGFLFRSILRMCIQNLKFLALSVREIRGVTQKIWAVPRYAHAPFSLKFLKGFCSDGPC